MRDRTKITWYNLSAKVPKRLAWIPMSRLQHNNKSVVLGLNSEAPDIDVKYL